MTNWFERSFGSDYMIVYRHRNWEQAAREAQQMAGWLGLPADAQVLDIGCGMGRHALALAELGYKVTGIDLSEALLREACEHNREGQIELIQGDMRRLPFEAGRFRATLNLFTSFGYFQEEQDNLAVLKEIRRVLADDGQFLIDFLNPVYIEQHLVPHSERLDEETGLHIVECRMIEDGMVKKKISIGVPGGDKRHYEERVRLYSLDWFKKVLGQAGLTLERIYGNYDGSPYSEMESKRMIMTGRISL